MPSRRAGARREHAMSDQISRVIAAVIAAEYRTCCWCERKPIGDGHACGKLFFCGEPDKSPCRWFFFEKQAAIIAMRGVVIRVLHYQVHQPDASSPWFVRLGEADYGNYRDFNEAVLDAFWAARDAMQYGHEANVWVREGSETACIL